MSVLIHVSDKDAAELLAEFSCLKQTKISRFQDLEESF